MRRRHLICDSNIANILFKKKCGCVQVTKKKTDAVLFVSKDSSYWDSLPLLRISSISWRLLIPWIPPPLQSFDTKNAPANDKISETMGYFARPQFFQRFLLVAFAWSTAAKQLTWGSIHKVSTKILILQMSFWEYITVYRIPYTTQISDWDDGSKWWSSSWVSTCWGADSSICQRTLDRMERGRQPWLNNHASHENVVHGDTWRTLGACSNTRKTPWPPVSQMQYCHCLVQKICSQDPQLMSS